VVAYQREERTLSYQRRILRKFLAEAKARPVQIVCAPDADGLAAGALAYRVLARQGFTLREIFVPPKGEPPLSSRSYDALRRQGSCAFLLLDVGVNEMGASLGPAATLFIDDHRFRHRPTINLISSSRRLNEWPVGYLLFKLLAPVFPVEDLAWLALIGAAPDHEDSLPALEEPSFQNLRRSDLQEMAVLVNSAFRHPTYDMQTPLSVLLVAQHPDEILSGQVGGVSLLRQYRAEVYENFQECSHAAPTFMWKVALIPFASPFRVEALIAVLWRDQLRQYLVIAANSGYLPGKVSFAVRTATDIPVPNFMQAVSPPAVHPPFFLGHRSSAYGITDLETWKTILRNMRFKDVERLLPGGSLG